MQETSQVGWLLYRHSTICKSGQFKIDSISIVNVWLYVNAKINVVCHNIFQSRYNSFIALSELSNF